MSCKLSPFEDVKVDPFERSSRRELCGGARALAGDCGAPPGDGRTPRGESLGP